MTVYYEDASIVVHHGDCLDVLRGLPDASVDAICTDPPYGLEFMGRTWDAPWSEADVNADAGFHGGGLNQTKGLPSFTGSTNPKCAQCKGTRRGRRDGTAKVAVCLCADGGRFPNVRAIEMRAFQQWCESWAVECLRVLKPGGHLLAFGGTRTSHRLTCGIEDAGFEIRDSIGNGTGQLAWVYGSGFPKSRDVGKAIDSEAGAEREVIGSKIGLPGYSLAPSKGSGDLHFGGFGGDGDPERESQITAPASDAAKQWDGWGTALKPSWEPIVVARKPLAAGTVAANVLRWGTGALNIDATRIGVKQWDDEQRLCSSCADHAEPSKRPTEQATRASTATSSAAPTSSARDATSPADTSKTGTGCSDGTRPDDAYSSSSTDASGRTPTDLSPTASSSTTGTTTRSTTDLKTCNSCGAGITTPITPGSLNSTRTDREPRLSTHGKATGGASSGRWPSNVVLDGRAAAALDTQSGETTSTARPRHNTAEGHNRTVSMGQSAADYVTGGHDDSGGASRFFLVAADDPLPIDTLGDRFRYVPKADASERPRVPKAGADAAWKASGITKRCIKCGKQRVNMGTSACACPDPDFQPDPSMSGHVSHPTVKPLDLMRWLVRLVTPPGGTCLDPFAGSGTTVEACILEGFRCVAIEREAEYLPLIEARVTRQRDPVRHIELTGGDLGLFDLGETT